MRRLGNLGSLPGIWVSFQVEGSRSAALLPGGDLARGRCIVRFGRCTEAFVLLRVQVD